MNPHEADISDILESLDRDRTSTTGDSTTLSLTDPALTSLDHQQLTRFWISERCSPELLPWPSTLMDRVLSRIRHQISRIEDLAADFSTSTGGNNQNLNLTLSILQSDLSRTQYLVRSLLRIRLSKLTKHAPFYLQQQERNSGSSNLLSPSEVQFLTHTQSLLQSYYTSSFLSSLPPHLRSLTDNTGGTNMVEPPDLKSAVFIRCLAEEWDSRSSGAGMASQLRRRAGNTASGLEEDNWLGGSGARGRRGDVEGPESEEGSEDGGEREFTMRKGQVWVVRWEDVKKGVLSGKLELL